VRGRLTPYLKDQWAIDLLDKLLCLDPKTRIDADTALNHDFFWTEPLAVDLERMLSHHRTSMFEFNLGPKQGRGFGTVVQPTERHPAPVPVPRVGVANNANFGFERIF